MWIHILFWWFSSALILIPHSLISNYYLSDLSTLSLADVDSVSEADRDTLAPLPPPQWNNQYPYSSTNYLPQNLSYIPPYNYTSTDSQSFVGSFVDGADKSVAGGGVVFGGGNGSAGSVHSGSGMYKLCISSICFICLCAFSLKFIIIWWSACVSVVSIYVSVWGLWGFFFFCVHFLSGGMLHVCLVEWGIVMCKRPVTILRCGCSL